MANYSILKAAIAQVIKTNDHNEITGNLLQQQLFFMVNTLGTGYQCMGVAVLTPTPTNPGTPDANVFYIASEPGTYANFGNIVINYGEVCLLTYNGTWSKQVTGVEKIGQYSDNPEYAYLIIDKAKRVLIGVKNNGEGAVEIPNIENIEIRSQRVKSSDDFILHGTRHLSGVFYKRVEPFSESEFATRYNEAKNATKEPINCNSTKTNPTVINVSTQSDFDNLDTTIKQRINNGYKHIIIRLLADVLYFNDNNYLNFSEANFANVSDVDVTILGNENCKVVADGHDYTIDEAEAFVNSKYKTPYVIQGAQYRNRHIFLDNDFKEIKISTDIKYARSQVEKVSSNPNYYRLLLAEEDAEKNPKIISVTCSFMLNSYIVDKIQDGYAYFYENTVIAQLATPANMDYTYSTEQGLPQLPRYKLVFCEDTDVDFEDNSLQDILVSCRYKKVHDCSYRQFIYIENTFKSVEISGIHFIGNANEAYQNYDCESNVKGLISIKDFGNSHIYIHNNKFDCLKSVAVGVSSKLISIEGQDVLFDNNVKVENNYIKDSYGGLICANHFTKNVHAIGNTIVNCGRSMFYSGCIAICGQDMLVSGNKIINCSYHNGIKTGHEWAPAVFAENYAGTEGIVENNTIGWTADFRAEAWKHGLMDSGAIYNYCRSKNLIIRNNYIFGFTGMCFTHGINLDGDSNNVSIIDNLIVNSGTLYDVKTSTKGSTYRPYYLDNNFMIGNIITSSIKFEGWGTTTKGRNFFIPNSRVDSLEDVYTYRESLIKPEYKEDDYLIKDGSVIYDKVIIPRKYTQIRDYFLDNHNIFNNIILK